MRGGYQEREREREGGREIYIFIKRGRGSAVRRKCAFQNNKKVRLYRQFILVLF
jgi:hypothetical protein